MFPTVVEQTIWRIKDVLLNPPSGSLTPDGHGTIVACLVMLHSATDESFRVKVDIDQIGELTDRLATEVLPPDNGTAFRQLIHECLQRIQENWKA